MRELLYMLAFDEHNPMKENVKIVYHTYMLI